MCTFDEKRMMTILKITHFLSVLGETVLYGVHKREVGLRIVALEPRSVPEVVSVAPSWVESF